MGKTRLGSVILASALFAFGCSASSGGTGTGGSPGSGGTSSGGTTGTGGNATGGTTGTGGSTGTGGITGTGGSATGGHTGGTTGTGGSTGTGGNSATGGTTGTGGVNSTGGTGGSSATGGTTGTGGSATGGVGGSSSSSVTVQLAQTEQKIEGFGINDNWNPLTDAQAKAMFDATSGRDRHDHPAHRHELVGLLLQQRRGGQHHDGEEPRRDQDHRVGLDRARQLQEQQQPHGRRTFEHQLLRLVFDDDRQLRENERSLRHVARERA